MRRMRSPDRYLAQASCRSIGLIDGVSMCQDHKYTKGSFLQSYKQVQVLLPVPFSANSKKKRGRKKKEE